MNYDIPHFTFKDHRSLDFGLLISDKNSFDGAGRDVSFVSVPGRDGDIIIDNGRYNNITISYSLVLLNKTQYSFKSLARQIKHWLASDSQYFRLWDTYDPEYFRLASYTDETNIEHQYEKLGTLSVKFNCKPFKYSYIGQVPVVFKQAGELYNAENYPSAPYVKVVGNGDITLTINESTFTLRDVNEFLELDFELPNAFKESERKNHLVSGADMSTLRLKPGYNQISWSGAVDSVEIIPRWCAL